MIESMDIESVARFYAWHGWRVFPLAPQGKTPLPGTRGFLDATRNMIEVTRTPWRQQSGTLPNNIGIATGAASGIWVLDVDTKDDKRGFESLSKLSELAGEEIFETATVTTHSGGLHLYYKYPLDRKIGRKISAFKRLGMPDIDVIGDDGYVVAPPSRIGEASYLWADEMPVAPTPQGLLDAMDAAEQMIKPRPAPSDAVRGACPATGDTGGMMLWLAARMPGEQDDALAWVMRALRDEGKTPEEARDLCWPIVAQWPASKRAWSERDIERHLRSTYR